MLHATSQVSFLKVLPLCCIVFVAFVAVDRAVSAGLKRVLLGSPHRSLRVYQPGPAAKYVILGNSRARAHFPLHPPSAFLNLGRGGMGLPISDALLRDYIATHGKPSWVIIETSFLADEESGVKVAGMVQIYSPRVRHLVRQEHPEVARFSAWFQTLRFNHNMLIAAFAAYLWPQESRSAPGPSNAKVPQISPQVLQEVQALEPFNLETSARNAQVVTDLLAYLKAQQIDVVMVMTPLLPERIRKIRNLGAFLDSLHALADAAGVRFVNCITHVQEHRYFADSLHLNAQGRDLFLHDFWRHIRERDEPGADAGARGVQTACKSHRDRRT